MRRLLLACALACGPTATDPVEAPQPAELPSAEPHSQRPPPDAPEEAHEAPPGAVAETQPPSAPVPPQEPVQLITAPENNTLRLVVVHAPPSLLKSELRQIEALEKNLQGDGVRVTREPASDDERAYAEGDRTELPPSWGAFDSVVLVRVADPRLSRTGKRFAQGLRDLVLIRPPDASPIYSERTNFYEGPKLDGEAHARLLRVLIDAATTEELGE